MEDLCESYSDLIGIKERIITQTSTELGFNFKFTDPKSDKFSVSHDVKVCQENPLYGLMPGAKPTNSKYVFGGQFVGLIEDQRPGLIQFFEYGSDHELNVQSILNFSDNRSARITSSKDAKGVTSLVKEMSCVLHNSEKSNTGMVLAAPKILGKNGPALEGILVGHHNRKVGKVLGCVFFGCTASPYENFLVHKTKYTTLSHQLQPRWRTNSPKNAITPRPGPKNRPQHRRRVQLVNPRHPNQIRRNRHKNVLSSQFSIPRQLPAPALGQIQNSR